MAVLTVRNLSNEVHRALRMRAAKNNRSAESEVREILASAVIPEQRILMGTAMAAMARGSGLTNDDVVAFEKAIEEARDKMPAEPVALK